MTAPIVPLAVYGPPLSGDREKLQWWCYVLGKRLGVRPIPVGAVAGSPTRVLALRERPPFIVEYVFLADTNDKDAVGYAVEWVLGMRDEHYAAISFEQQLQAVFGPELRESTNDWDTNPMDLIIEEPTNA